MKKIGFKIGLATVGTLFMAQEAMAVPAFARQTGADCTACHTHHIPILNSYGKDFKMSGYTDSSNNITRKNANGVNMLSVPTQFGASVLAKTRYIQDDKPVADGKVADGATRGTFEMFDEGFIQVAGKVAQNWGFISEFDGTFAAGKFVGAWDIAGGKGGLSIFTSDGFGPYFGQELWTTAIYRPDRLFEDRKATQAAQVSGIGAHAATGVTTFLRTGGVFGQITLFTPEASSSKPFPESGFPSHIAYRAAYEIHTGEIGGMIGVFGTSGESTRADEGSDAKVNSDGTTSAAVAAGLTEVTKKTESFGIDTEWEGHSWMANAVYATTKGDEDGESIYVNGTSDTTAIQLNGSYAVTDRFFVKAAYLSYTVKDDDTKDFSAITPGIEYMINDNMRTAFEYTMKDYADDDVNEDYNQMLAMLMVAF